MSAEPEIKRWTAKRKAALIREIYKGQTTVPEAARQHDLTPSEIEGWIEEAEAGMENALRANPRESAWPRAMGNVVGQVGSIAVSNLWAISWKFRGGVPSSSANGCRPASASHSATLKVKTSQRASMGPSPNCSGAM